MRGLDEGPLGVGLYFVDQLPPMPLSLCIHSVMVLGPLYFYLLHMSLPSIHFKNPKQMCLRIPTKTRKPVLLATVRR